MRFGIHIKQKFTIKLYMFSMPIIMCSASTTHTHTHRHTDRQTDILPTIQKKHENTPTHKHANSMRIHETHFKVFYIVSFSVLFLSLSSSSSSSLSLSLSLFLWFYYCVTTIHIYYYDVGRDSFSFSDLICLCVCFYACVSYSLFFVQYTEPKKNRQPDKA